MKIKLISIVLVIVTVVFLVILFITRTSGDTEEKSLTGYAFRVSGYSEDYFIYDLTAEKKELGRFTANIATLGLSEGEHRLLFSSTNRENIEVVINSSQDKYDYDITFQKINAEIEYFKAINELSGDNVTDARFFNNNTWVAGFTSEDNSVTESYVIKILKKVGDEWQTVTIGTAINEDYLRLEGAPEDLINYVAGL